MSGPHDGRYIIILALASTPPPIPTGANSNGFASDFQVFNGGQNIIWNVRHIEHGTYTLALEHPGRPGLTCRFVDNNVVVSNTDVPTFWKITRVDDDAYTITLASDTLPERAWTSDSFIPGTSVKISTMEFPEANRKWRFIPIDY